MDPPLRLLCVMAHPDDETFAAGGILARYARMSIETYVVTATRGEAGRHGTAARHPGASALAAQREQEEREAAAVLGVRGVWFLDCRDGQVDRADPARVIRQIVCHIRRIRPHVLVTLSPYGGDGHPDHVAVSQLAASAALAAAMPAAGTDESSHAVSKLYFIVWTRSVWDQYQAAFRPVRFVVDGTPRSPAPWPEWGVTTALDTSDVCRTVLEAARCHRSQLAGLSVISRLDEDGMRRLWGVHRLYRAISLVNGGRACERDLFDGVRAVP